MSERDIYEIEIEETFYDGIRLLTTPPVETTEEYFVSIEEALKEKQTEKNVKTFVAGGLAFAASGAFVVSSLRIVDLVDSGEAKDFSSAVYSGAAGLGFSYLATKSIEARKKVKTQIEAIKAATGKFKAIQLP